jgi:hypothetical protein
MPRRSLLAAARTAAAVGLTLLMLPSSATAAREIPVGLANVNDQNLRDGRWLYAMRFVVDRDTTMYRFFSQMKAKGASWDEHTGTKCTTYGAGCYGAGDGGLIEARLVTVKPDGTPDLANVLARETVDPQKRYFETKAAYGISTISLFWYFNMGGVGLKANTPYVMVYRNVHGDPAHNFSSANSPTVKASEAGPNAGNNLDPNAPGAIAGLDPREAVAWSTDGGGTWSWGRQVGPYYGSTTTDDGVRLPHYAWQASPTSKPETNQPYSAYWSTCAPCTLTATSVPRATTLTEAGGYAPVGKSVGVVTVKNLRTGETGRTASLGSGIARGRLDNPVDVAVGDAYQITHTGTVYRAEADNYVVRTLTVGSGAFPFTTTGFGSDRAELFALPHPYFKASATTTPPAPAPTDITAPDTSISAGPTGAVWSGSASFGFEASETEASFDCRLDSGAWTACASPHAVTGLAAGTHTFEARARDAAGNVDQSPAVRTWSINAPAANKAAGQPTTSSSSESPGLTPGYAVDGSLTTRWSSGFSESQWWQVDLGASRQVDRVEIDWEYAYASRYRILTSLDGVTFSEAADVSMLGAGLKATSFPARAARYVRVEGITRATIYGISFWEARVYGPTDAEPTPAPEPPPAPEPTPAPAPTPESPPRGKKPRRTLASSTPGITLAVEAKRGTIRLRGRVKNISIRPGLKLRLRARGAGRWRTVSSRRVSANTRFGFRWNSAPRGRRLQVRVVLPDGTRSRTVAVRVR